MAGPGDHLWIGPGHRAWVVGDEPYVCIDFEIGEPDDEDSDQALDQPPSRPPDLELVLGEVAPDHRKLRTPGGWTPGALVRA